MQANVQWPARTTMVTEAPDSGTIFDPADRTTFITAARNALSVASTSLFILEREISDAERTHKVSKHLTRIEEQLGILAKLLE